MSSPRVGVSRRWLCLLLLASAVRNTPAQQSVPARTETDQPVHVVNMHFEQVVGFCGGCYCGGEIEASPQGVTLFKRASHECQQKDPQKYRDFRVEADISKKHWKELEWLANKGTLLALPNSTGCASCVDGVDEQIEVKFSDGTKKSVRYPAGSPPKEIQALSEKLSRLLGKLEDELVNYK